MFVPFVTHQDKVSTNAKEIFSTYLHRHNLYEEMQVVLLPPCLLVTRIEKKEWLFVGVEVLFVFEIELLV